MARVLLISDALVGPVMSGSGVRSWEMARTLAREHQVSLALTRPTPPLEASWSILRCTTHRLRSVSADFDIVVSANFPPLLLPFLRRTGKYLVVDLYDPVIIEESARFQSGLTDHYTERLRATLLQLQAADFFLCANERQRLFWLGMLSAGGRLPPQLYVQDPTLSRAVAVAPFGIPEEPPHSSRRVLKGVHPGIGPEDRVILWGGGIWSWLDVETLLHTVAELAQHRDDVKLFFMGVDSPDPRVPPMEAGRLAIALSQELGLYERVVFFNQQWIPYQERVDYLLEADIGVSLHRPGLEGELAARIRVQDYLWAGLPAIVSGGDSAAELVERSGVGLVVPLGSESALRTALTRLLDDAALRRHCQEQNQVWRKNWFWQETLRPLGNYCQSPGRLPGRSSVPKLWARILRLYLGRVRHTWRRAGWRGLREGIRANLGSDR